MVAGLAFRNLYREGAPSLHAILLTADVFGVTYPPGTRLCSSPFADRVGAVRAPAFRFSIPAHHPPRTRPTPCCATG